MRFQIRSTVQAIGMLAFAPVCAATVFSAGNLVVSVEGNGSNTGSYTDNQAAPLTLYQYAPNGTGASATFVNSLMLPQIQNGANLPVSGEYGSSSEGILTLSGNGQYLSIAGYGINATTFNNNYLTYDPAGNTKPTALAQSGSMTGQSSYTPVARVVALIDANGNVNSTTGLFNVFSGNNPRSTYTRDGTNIYVSGQGTTGDTTQGVFYTTVGSSSATAISGTSQDTRVVTIYNGQLYVSVDSKDGSTNHDFVGTLGSAGSPPTTLVAAGPTSLNGFGGDVNRGQEVINASSSSSYLGNNLNSGKTINLSPESYFFASPSVLYVADSGSPKNTAGNNSLVGDGGLQKWVNSKADGTGTWSLEYTLYAGLNLVANSTANTGDIAGTTGLLGLTGQVLANGTVQLYATNYTIGDTDQTYLYGITDALADTTSAQAAQELFSVLATAPADTNFKGVSFAPSTVPEPAPMLLAGLGMGALLYLKRRSKA